jgi:hypothetical protein
MGQDRPFGGAGQSKIVPAASMVAARWSFDGTEPLKRADLTGSKHTSAVAACSVCRRASHCRFDDRTIGVILLLIASTAGPRKQKLGKRDLLF